MTTTGLAAQNAAKAAEVAAKLKPGTYDAVQGLADRGYVAGKDARQPVHTRRSPGPNVICP